MAYYPLSLDMTERRCLVVGGGPVAERKVAGLLDAGARLTVVSPAATDRLRDWARTERIRLRLREYAAGDLAGHSVVFVATDAGRVNAEVARDARAAGVLINAADDPAHCDFILPAGLRRGDGVPDLRAHLAAGCAAERADLASASAAVARTAAGLAGGREEWIATVSSSAVVREAFLELQRRGRTPRALVAESPGE